MAASLTTYQLTPLYAGPVVGAEPVQVAVAGTVGPTGPAGEQGVAGPAGEGSPPGGATGTVLQKLSAADGDADWFDLFGSVNTWTGGQNFIIVSITSPSAAAFPFLVIGAAGQSVDLTRWFSSTFATLASVGATGIITAAGFVGPGADITGLNATQLTTGTVADARLSANVPLLDAANTFDAGQNFSAIAVTSPSAVTIPLSVVADPFQTAALTSWFDSTFVTVASVTLAGFVGPGAGLTGLAPANVSAGVFVASQVFTSPFAVRQSGGVAGTDELEVTHDGNAATLRNKETGGIRFRNAADNLTTFAVSNIGTANAVAFAGNGSALTNLPVDLLSPLAAAEISVTGATTATISRMHVCSGTTADYTVTLPAASGNAGKLIGFRMSTALTKLVTIDGNGAELIDGATARAMWAGESAILLCDGSNWFKVAGRSLPMNCSMYLAATQTSVATSSVVKALLDTVNADPTGMMADTTNKRINVIRSSLYLVSGAVTIGGLIAGNGLDANSARTLTQLWYNGSGYANAECGGLTGGYPAPFAVKPRLANATDRFELAGHHNQGSTGSFYSSAGQETSLSVTEVPQW